MKILYVTSLPITYNTSANLRNIALIKGFKSLGHDVHILNIEVSEDSIGYDSALKNEIDCPIFYVKANKLYSSMSAKKNQSNKLKVIKIIKNAARSIYYSLKITDSLASSVKNLEYTKLTDTKYDYIISSSDFRSSHLLAQKFIKLYPEKYNKWIQYWGDPLTIDINNKNKLPKSYIKNYEKRLLSSADKVIYVSPITLERQKDMFPKMAFKMNFIPIAYIGTRKIVERENTNTLRIGYFGDYFSDSRNIKNLYSAIDDLNVEIVIAGNSDLALKGKKNLKVMTRQPYNKIIDLENNCDILVCLCNKEGTQLPGKIYHYAATNKKILIITEKNSEVLKEYLLKYDPNEKYIFTDNNINSIKKILVNFINQSEGYSSPPLDAFNSKNVAETFIKEISK